MDKHLTEISNSYLFRQYLQCLGITPPRFRENREWVQNNRVIARVCIGQEESVRFYIAAADMCRQPAKVVVPS